MAKKITFQFDDALDYQLQAIRSTVELFKGLPRQADGLYRRPERIRMFDDNDPIRNPKIVTESRLLQNLRQVQLSNKLFADSYLANNNFTIEMETGTGKTYVYLRSILELYKEYDFRKFMIVVPSIAIRKGVEKSIGQLTDHFKRLYDLDISKHSFSYDSSNPKKVSTNFVETSDLSICVLNIQAFNKDSNKIRSEDEYGQILWEDIKYINPIVIIDEPQKIEGQKGKKSKSLKAIDDIEPLFVLRYSATHKQLYNQIYKLDSYDAYKNNLVKKITVKTINGVIDKDYPYIRYVSFTKNLKAKIEIFSQKQGDSIRIKTFDVSLGDCLEELSGGLAQYRNMRISDEPHKHLPLKIDTQHGLIELDSGESNNGFDNIQALRIQIRLAITNHFEKQLSILKNGKKIKALTLFFVDSVSKIRDHTRSDNRGEYLRIFDEEYRNIIKDYEAQLDSYKQFFPEYSNILKVREGYFAVDKKNKEVEIDDWDSKNNELDVKIKAQEDIERGISLILERKDELISFDEPLSFIFSHSALREGWDNPNVFTLCTLKNGSSDIAKKQEIGRGLRLPVDITGNRCLDTKINELTIIANDSYETFTRLLQEDFNDSMKFNKHEVTADILTVSLEHAGIPSSLVTAELVDTYRKELIKNGILDTSNILNRNIELNRDFLINIGFENEVLVNYTDRLIESFTELMIQKGSHRIDIRNGDNEPIVNSTRSFVTENEFKQVYIALTTNLAKRTLYKCNVDIEKFSSECINEINNYLRYFRINKSVNISTGKANFNVAQMFEMEKSGDKTFDIDVGMKAIKKSDLEVVNYIMHHTMLPRLSIFKILSHIEKRDALNFQDMLDQVTQIILKKLNDFKADNITSYEVIEGYELDEGQIFALDTINESDFIDEWRVFQASPNSKNSLNEYYKMDSIGERNFANKLESNANILLFTKLKKGGFVIDTPYGNYSPDWAVICRKDGLDVGSVGIYFIIETKSDKQLVDLTKIEVNKIKCGELHFKAVSDLVKFDWVNSYEDFKVKFGVKESI